MLRERRRWKGVVERVAQLTGSFRWVHALTKHAPFQSAMPEAVQALRGRNARRAVNSELEAPVGDRLARFFFHSLRRGRAPNSAAQFDGYWPVPAGGVVVRKILQEPICDSDP